jgi:Mn-dependent DtxR family transcriptional regulator
MVDNMVNTLSEATDHLTKEQLVLMYICRKKTNERVTSEVIEAEFHLPRSTTHDILMKLETFGLIKSKKEGKTKIYFADERFAQRILTALTDLQSAYAFALECIKSDIRKRVKK